MIAMRSWATIAAATICLAGPMSAQELRGTVRDSANRQAISGAVLLLLDSTGRQLGRNLTNERGEYHIIAPAAMRRMRIQRIGYRPREVGIPAPEGGVTLLNVTMVAIPTMLEMVQVRSGAECSRRSDRLAALSLLEQARAGLLATIVAREAKPATMVRLRFQQQMAPNTDRVEYLSVHIDSTADLTASFQAARTAAEFVRLGFVVDIGSRDTYLGPDAETLIDDAFRDGYCFHLRDAERDRPHQVGLAFVPAHLERGRVGVDGTLWIDTAQRALREIVFDYIGLDQRLSGVKPGGRIAFRELANGVVFIDRWSFRLPGVLYDTTWTRNNLPVVRTWFFAQEGGGEVAAATWPDGFSWEASLGRLRALALDTKGIPVTNIVVRLANTDYIASPDASGIVEIPRLVPGPYSVIVLDTALTPLGMTIPTTLKFVAERDSITQARFVARTAKEYVTERCRVAERWTIPPPKAAQVIVRVVGPDGNGIRGVFWRIFREASGSGWVRVAAGSDTGTDGVFQVCAGLAPGDALRIEVRTERDGPPTTVIRTLTRDVLAVKITAPTNP